MWPLFLLMLSGGLGPPAAVRIPLTAPLLVQIPLGAWPHLEGDTLMLLGTFDADSVRIAPLSQSPPDTSSPSEVRSSQRAPSRASPAPDPLDLQVQGTRVFSAAYGDGGLRLEGGLDLRIGGNLPGGGRVEGVIRDQGLGPQARTVELARLDEAYLRLSRGGFRLTLGNFQLTLPGFRRDLQGVSLEGEGLPVRYRAFYGLERGTYRRVEIQARSGFNGPYLLTGSPRPGLITILRGSEQVFLNGVLMRPGEDYRLDYETGALTFTPRRILSEGDHITVIFQEVRGPVPQQSGGLTLTTRLRAARLRAFFLSEGYSRRTLAQSPPSGKSLWSFGRTRLFGLALQGSGPLSYQVQTVFSDHLADVLWSRIPERGHELQGRLTWRLGALTLEGGVLRRSPGFHPLLDTEPPGEGRDWGRALIGPPRFRAHLGLTWQPLSGLVLQARWAMRDSLRRRSLSLSAPAGPLTYTLEWVRSTLLDREALTLRFPAGQIRLFREQDPSLRRDLGIEGQGRIGRVSLEGHFRRWQTLEGAWVEALFWAERPLPGGHLRVGGWAVPPHRFSPLFSGSWQGHYGSLSGEVHVLLGTPEGRMEERFLRVGEGRGTYRRDPQTGLMVPDPLGDHIRVLVPTGDPDPAARRTFRLHLGYTGSTVLVQGGVTYERQGDLLQKGGRLRLEGRPTGLWGPYGGYAFQEERGGVPFREERVELGLRLGRLRIGGLKRRQEGLWGQLREARLYLRRTPLELYGEARRLDQGESRSLGLELTPRLRLLSARLMASLELFYRWYRHDPGRYLFPEDFPGLGYRYSLRLSRPLGQFLLIWSASGDGGEGRRARNAGSLSLQLSF